MYQMSVENTMQQRLNSPGGSCSVWKRFLSLQAGEGGAGGAALLDL